MIVPMRRLTLVAMKSDEEDILKALQKTGTVQITYTGEAEAADDTAAQQWENAIARLSGVYASLRTFDAQKRKGGILSPRPEIPVEKLREDFASALQMCEKAEALERELNTINSEKSIRRALISTLLPWRDMSVPLDEVKDTRASVCMTGLIDMDKIQELEGTDCAAEVFQSEGRECAALLLCQAGAEEEMRQKLKETGWIDVRLPALPETPAKAIQRLEAECAGLETDADGIRAKLEETASGRELLRRGMDAAAIERDRARGRADLSATQAAFILQGWIRGDEVEKTQKVISGVTSSFYFETTEPEEGDTPPSVMKNNKLIAPYEAIVNMYSRPSYNGIDATPIMAPFYFLFFGMMLSDAGYGLLLLLGGWAYLKFAKPRGGTAQLVKIIMMGGLSTIICGPLIGTFFGISWNDLFGLANGPFPLILDPIKDVLEMMILCCALGLLHMFTGIITRMYMCFKRGDPASAIFDHFSWMLLIIGLVILLAFPAAKTAGMAAAGVGGGMLLLFSGRSKKNPIKRIGSGLSALYNITGYLSDTLSYVRIFALGLVSGAMGMVFNLIGGMLAGAFGGVAGAVISTLLAAALLVVLHLFSLFINTLGTYAHCARLQFIEFFGKFYEADGLEFKPLQYNTRHVYVQEER